MKQNGTKDRNNEPFIISIKGYQLLREHVNREEED